MSRKRGKKVSNNSRKEIKRKVLQAFQESPEYTFNYKRIAKKLNIKKEALKKLVMLVMEEMGESGELVKVDRGNFKLNYKQEIIYGTIDMTNNGAAYLVCDNLDEDIFIPPRSLGKALHRDKVKAGLVIRKSGRRLEAEVLEVEERAKAAFVGTVELHERFAFVVADEKKMHTDIFLPTKEMGKVISGEKVLVEIVDWPDDSKNPIGKVVDVLGMAGENEVEMHAILAEFGLPYGFSDAVLNEAEKIPSEISKKEIAKRRDMRDVVTFTIDPDDAKDFDDALSIVKLKDDLWEVGVHIADVSHYIKENSMLDKEAYNRATSVYLVDRVVPMLPERLSNDLCSLNPKTDKLCFSAVFQIDEKAEVKKRWFGRTVIHSDHRFTYGQAQKGIDSGKGKFADELKLLNDLAQKLRARRFRKGSIGFESVEVKFDLDEKGNPLGVSMKHHMLSNELIEEFMLLANREVAESIGKARTGGEEKTFVYRVHDSPDPEKLNHFRDFVAKLGYQFNAKNKKQISSSFNGLFKEVSGKTEEYVIEKLAIRTMAKATYTTKNIGHYGLAFPYYSHFTSPIRRYPDVMTHRLLQQYLDGGKSAPQPPFEDRCKHCSAQEKLATEAERASIKYKQVQFLKDKIGVQFAGIISGMNDYGIFVELDENKCEGMIRLRAMSDDYYYFDAKEYTVVGSRTGKYFEIGDSVEVKILRADLVKKQLDFTLVTTF